MIYDLWFVYLINLGLKFNLLASEDFMDKNEVYKVLSSIRYK